MTCPVRFIHEMSALRKRGEAERYLIRGCEVPPKDRFLNEQSKGIRSDPCRCVPLRKTTLIVEGYPLNRRRRRFRRTTSPEPAIPGVWIGNTGVLPALLTVNV